MKDQLLDIVQHTHGLGVIDLAKIIGTNSGTDVAAIAEDKSVIVDARFIGVVAEFIGTFGMPNLAKLSTILNISEYKEDARLSITTKPGKEPNTTVPEGIHFENKAGDFKNDYRFMAEAIINDKVKNAKMRSVKWGVEIAPSVLSIQRLKFQASANSDQTTFTAKTDKGDLVFYFGDHSSHAGHFVFATGVTGSISKAWNWPINVVISILNLPGDKMLRISDEGAAQITVDSGIAVWNYTLPAMTK